MTAPLNGYTVVDLSSGIAGGYATKILADGGADVIKVESPEGDPLRRWSASGAAIPDGHDGALFTFLAGGKRSVVADDPATVEPLIAGAILVNALGDMGGLGMQKVRHLARLPVELVLFVTDILDAVADDPVHTTHVFVEFGLVGQAHLAADHHPVRRGKGFASDTRIRLLGQESIEDGIGNTVADLVRVPL